MSPLPLRTGRISGLGVCLLLLALAGCVGPPVQVVPNEYSEARSADAIEADLAHCDEISNEVQAEYGPHVEIGDDVFAAASENFAIHNRYKAACMTAKGYHVKDSLGKAFDPVELPASAVAKARGGSGPAETPR